MSEMPDVENGPAVAAPVPDSVRRTAVPAAYLSVDNIVAFHADVLFRFRH
jgi:hypothetical protein